MATNNNASKQNSNPLVRRWKHVK